MNKENPIRDKSFKFALKVVEIYKYLLVQHEYVLSKQLLRSGTSIGANIQEAIQGQSKKDFISKLSISLKEAYETEYWMNLLIESDYIDSDKYKSINVELNEIIRILTSIIKTSKERYIN